MLLQSNPGELNSAAPGFSLKGIDGKFYSLEDFSGDKILAVIFMCNHCPYVKAVAKRFVTLQLKFTDKKIRLIGISPNDVIAYPEDSYENMKIFASEYELNFPYLIDESQQTAKNYGAVCTPDIYVYNEERKLKYRGRLDDNWQDESKVKSNDLEKAIEEILEGKNVSFEQIPSMGCSIKWK
ncbi:MAG: thioredoxin family protein [Ignavibacteriae bacterium]|nr:thioredoxin family protein [Ignavibacteriota bacterium]